MKVWFMRDNHTFAFVGDGTSLQADMEAKAKACFAQDGCGMLSARDSRDHGIGGNLHGHPMPGGGYGVTEGELRAFFGRVDEYANWEARS